MPQTQDNFNDMIEFTTTPTMSQTLGNARVDKMMGFTATAPMSQTQDNVNVDDMMDGLVTAMATAFVKNLPVKEHLSQFGATPNRTQWNPNAPLDRNNLDPAIHSPFDLTHCDINTIQHMDVIDGLIQRFEAEATALMNVRPLRHDERVQYDKLVERKNWIFYLEEMQVKGWGDTDYNPHLFQPAAPFSTCA